MDEGKNFSKEIKATTSKVVKGPSAVLRLRAFFGSTNAQILVKEKLKKKVAAERKKAAQGKSKGNDKKAVFKNKQSSSEEIGAPAPKEKPKKNGKEAAKVAIVQTALATKTGIFVNSYAMVTPLNKEKGEKLKNRPKRGKTVTQTAKTTKVTKMKVR